jgi:hypothetical protein
MIIIYPCNAHSGVTTTLLSGEEETPVLLHATDGAPV